MANLPEPDWLTLFESAKRAEQAFGVEQSAVETALVAAFHDGKIRTRGRCRSFFGHDTLLNLAGYTWDRAGVIWQGNEFAIPDDRPGRGIHIFSDVVVCRDDLEAWFTGAMPDSQQAAHEAPENLTPKPPDKGEKPQAKRKRNVEADAKLKNRIEMVFATVRTEWPDESKRPGIRTMAKHLVENHKKKLGFSFETIRQILRGTYPASEHLKIRGL